ncbi:MAG TPA: WD40 repeat domain-containing protein [Blastocatellia bacterium]|nr:WD40 repeat domain-containing protein [Blastocatellia bacterium]
MSLCAGAAHAQRGANNDWVTDNADPQRTAAVKADAKINKDSVAKPGAVKFLWKLKLKNAPRQLNNLTAPATLERLIGYRGFRMLGFVAGSGDNLFTIDTDLGRMEWEKHLNAAPIAQTSTGACPGGMTTGVARPTLSAIASGGGGFGPGRNTPAKSTVGEPWAGATTLSLARPQPNTPAGPPPGAQGVNRPGGQGANRPGAPPMGGGFGGGPNLIYALASDGMLHSMHLSGGQEYQPPVKFLPPGANASGLIIVDGKAYAVTSQSCNGMANGLWAYDFETQQASTWKGNVAGSSGAAFGPDGVIYVATGAGEGSANSIVAIDPKTLQTKSAYSAGGEFASTPVVFEYKGKTLIAAAAADGSVHLVDAANMAAASLITPGGSSNAEGNSAPGALASWQDREGQRWILVAHTGALPAGFTPAGGAVTKGAILAWKLGEEGGKLALKPGWASRNMVSPLTPTIINGVVLATSSGEFRTNDGKLTAAMRAARSGRAVIYLLDGATGKELWSSGATITSFARGNALSGGMGQFYLTTYDGAIYAFGFPMEH